MQHDHRIVRIKSVASCAGCCRCASNFNRFARLQRSGANDLGEKPASTDEVFFQFRVNGVEHVARLASFGEFDFNPAGEDQPVANFKFVNVQVAYGDVLADCAGVNVKSLIAHIVEVFKISDADGLQRRIVLFVVVTIAFQSAEEHARFGQRLFWNAAGRDIDSDHTSRIRLHGKS